MSVIAEETQRSTRVAGRALQVGRHASHADRTSTLGGTCDIADPHDGTQSSELSAPLRSRTAGLVFQVVLLMAACLSLVAVIQQVQATTNLGTGVNDPPPAVFVTTD